MRPSPNSRPNSVSSAVKLIYASIGVGLVAFPFRIANMLEPNSDQFVKAYAYGIVTLAIMALWSYLIGQGHNWARILWIVMFVCGSLITMTIFQELLKQGAFGVAVYVVQTILQVAATVLLFTRESQAWFNNVSHTKELA